MKPVVIVLAAAVAFATGCNSMGSQNMAREHHRMDAQPGHGGTVSMMAGMDANGDGMVSKDEFLKTHEAIFDRMKGPNGMISLKDMEMRRQKMMEHHEKMRQNRQMPGIEQNMK